MRAGLILIMKMERLLEAAKAKLEEAKTRRACRGAASLCSKALAMDEKEQFPERAEVDAVIRKAEQKGREFSFRRCPIHNQKLGKRTTTLRPHFQHLS